MAREPLEPGVVEGVFAYAEKSVYAGETISLRVSSSYPYSMTVVQLGPNTDEPSSTDVPLAQYPFQNFPAQQQPITPGSYVNIERQLPPRVALPALTLECWVRPWRVTGEWQGMTQGWQGLISQYTYDSACGFGLFIDDSGHVNFYVGDGGGFQAGWMHLGTAPALTLLNWSHIVGVWDSSSNTASLWVNGAASGSWQMPQGFQLKPGKAPLRLGAYGDGSPVPYTKYCLDGDLAMPVIYNYALTPAQIQQRYSEQGLKTPPLKGLIGCWPLTEERGDQLTDISSFKRNGKIINHATWMIGGPSFNGSLVPRYTPPYNPATDPKRGHGLRLASDDLYDCGWGITKTYTIPLDAKPGIYSGRILYGEDLASVYDVSFVVKKPRGTKSDILVLCSTNTWAAYNQYPFQNPTDPAMVLQSGVKVPRLRDYGTEEQDAPEYCFYLNHHASDYISPPPTNWTGQPTYFVGLNMPCPIAGPYVLMIPDPPASPPSINYSHLVRAERFLHLWLEKQSYDFDLATDLDLNSNPQLLDNYKVLIINGHSEYWSIQAYENVQTFLNNKGRVAVLSGNTMFWRVSFDPSGTVMECRKVPYADYLGGRPNATIGEMWHSDDGLRGGLMREAGYPAYPLIGLECAGWFDYSYAENFGVYKCMDDAAPLFNTPIKTGLKEGDCFGYISQAGIGAVGAVGHEYDIRVSNPQMCTVPPASTPPTGAPLPSEPPDIQTLAQSVMPPATFSQQYATVFDYFARWYEPPPKSPPLLIAEMIYWERPAGGQVFHAGAIGSGWTLSYDSVMQNLISNVLSHFGLNPPSLRERKRTKAGGNSSSKRTPKDGGPAKKSSAPSRTTSERAAAKPKPSKSAKTRR